VTDLLGGQVQVIFHAVPSSIEFIRAGKLHALAVTAATRSESLPDIPTVAEFVPGYEASSWLGVGVPKATPAEIVDKQLLLDHFVSGGQQRFRNGEAERLCGLKVDDELLGRLHQRKVGRLFALEDPASVGADLAIHFGKVEKIAPSHPATLRGTRTGFVEHLHRSTSQSHGLRSNGHPWRRFSRI
jgi:hypothetical protein